MKTKAMILACMLLASGLFVGTVAYAQTYNGIIEFSDLSGHMQDYFEPSDWVVFDVTVQDGSVPLQSQTVSVVIVGNDTIGEVFNFSYTTDSYGQFSGDSLDDSWTSKAIGFYYTYVNYSGNLVVSDTFRIYDPVPWTATGWTSYNTELKIVFFEGEQVTLHVVVLDQYDNPFDGGYSDSSYEIIHEALTVASGNFATNVTGGAQWTYNTFGQYQFGRYYVTIFNDASPPQSIGSFTFFVALPDLATIQLSYYGENRTVFKEGEWVGYTITLYYQGILPYNSDSYAARVLLYKEGETNPLENNTLSTNNDGEDYDSLFHNIGYGDSVKGIYYVQVYNQTWNVIGTAMFLVIGILPEKAVYSQRDTVTLTVTTSLEEAYTVLIANNAGVTVTGASWNVPAGTFDWWRPYTFPDIPDGTYRVEVYMDALLLGSHYFELKKISLNVMLSQTAFVPGQSGTLFWRAVNNHDGSPISITGDSIMHYTDDDWISMNKDLGDVSGTSGSFTFTVPRDSMVGSSGNIVTEARDTAGYSDTEHVDFNVQSLSVDVDTDRSTYLPGDTMFITLSSQVGSTNSPVPDVDIRLTVQSDGTTVGSSWTVMTNNAGTVATTFQIPTSATKAMWVLVINATFSGNSDIKYNGTYGFNIMTDPILSLILYQQKEVYSPGEVVTVPYRILRNGAETTGAEVTFEAYIMQESQINIALGFGENGVITFTLPSNVEGSLFVNAVAITSDGIQAGDSLSSIPVSSGQLVLFTAKSIYLPGENITWIFVLSGDTETSVTYRITDPDGYLLAQGAAVNRTFSLILPAVHAVNPTARVYVTGSSGTYFASSTAQVYSGYFLEFRVLKNSYSPGDIMKINYTIQKIGDVPDNINGFQLQLNLFGEHIENIWVTEHFGVLEYQIPENTTDGKHLVNVVLEGAPESFNDFQTVIIDSDAGELAHGTIFGMNASAFLALIFAIVALIIAIIGVVKWRSMKKAKTPASQKPPVQPVQPVEPIPPPPPQAYQEPAPVSQPPEYLPPQQPQQ
jgi:hypothetical protein